MTRPVRLTSRHPCRPASGRLTGRAIRAAALAAVASLVAASFGGAADWPMGGRAGDRNPVSPEATAPADWEFGSETLKPRNVRWNVPVGTSCRAMGGPVVSGGLVWVGTVEYDPGRVDRPTLACYRERDGVLVYQYKSDRLPNRLAEWRGHSLTGSPMAEGDRLWFVTNRREVVCLDTGLLRLGTGDARVVWKLDMVDRLKVSPSWVHTSWPDEHGSPVGYGEFLYVPTGNAVTNDGGRLSINAPAAPSLVCLRKSTGEVVWSDNSPGPVLLTGHRASPLVAEISGRVLVIHPQGDGWVRAFEALTGKLVWKFDVNPKTAVGDRVFSEAGRVGVFGTPVFAGGRVFLATGVNPESVGEPGRLFCLDPMRFGDVSSTLVIDSVKERPNPNSAVVWEFASAGPAEGDRMHQSLGSVAVHSGLVFAADTYGFVHCLDAKTGRQQWSHNCKAAVFGNPLVAGGHLYVADNAGVTWVLDAKATGRVHGRFEADRSVFAGPVFANGTLYILTERRLYAIGTNPVERPK